MKVDLHDSCDDAVAEAADALVRAIRTCLARSDTDRVAVALSGGSALKAWPAAAATLGDVMGRLRLTWVDERCVPETDPSSNRGATHRMGAAEPAEELPLWLDGESADGACARVRAELRRWDARVDVALLGMGPDGHIASLFPGHPWDGELVRYVDDSPKPPPRRMTLTRALLSTARSSILLATGEPKRAALTALLEGDPRLPAVGLPNLSIFTDLDLRDLEPEPGSRT